MKAVWAHITIWAFSAVVLTIIGYAIWGAEGGWAVLAVVLAVWLIWQFYYILKLVRWIESPKINKMPGSKSMLWAEVFSMLLEQAKSRKKRKQKLTSALQRFYRASEAMPNGMLILDKTGRISWMNGLAVEHLNLNPQSDMNGILRNVVRLPEFIEFLDKPLTNETHEIKIMLPKDGGISERTLNVTRTPFQTDEALLITRDISESEQLNNMRTAFVANVSHELRTPLTVINGFLETMSDTPSLPAEQSHHFIGLMQKEGTRMQNLLADLLTLSRLESGKSPERSPIDLSGLARTLAEDGEALSTGRHEISINVQPGVWINGVYNDLYNGLSNLVFNAVRYTPAGGKINISLKEMPSENRFMLPPVYFAVEDNGPGIAAEHLPHLTERFYRVDKGRSRQSGGTGLGLAITKHALAEHRSALQIHSEVGKGSEFGAIFSQIPPPIKAEKQSTEMVVAETV